MNGDWRFFWIAGVRVVGVALVKRLGLISTAAARRHLNQGAQVVDVRSPDEFRSHHLPGTLSLPLGDLGKCAPRRFADKQQVLLLHCLSGTRSAAAKRLLQELGYTRVFNLGSYHRARRILQPRKASDV
jgi:phage shock protein E